MKMNSNNDVKNYWLKIFDYFKQINYNDFDDATKYAFDVVINKKYLTSKMIKFACQRHLLFLYKQEHEPDFNFFYDKTSLAKIISFASKIIVPEINKPFIFPPFRKFMAGFVFGWVYKSDPTSFITGEIFDVEARKQWKSSFWSMIMLAVCRGLLKEGNPRVFICGPQKATSKIPYEIAQNYLIKSAKLRKNFIKYNTIQIRSKNQGVVKHLAFEKSALEGQNPSMIILTEYHLHKDDTMQESAKSSKNLSRKNQIIVYDTTKGHNIESVCYVREQDYKKFLKEQIENPFKVHNNFDIFLWAAELDAEDYENWQDDSLWVKANPGLGISVSLQDLKSEYNKITDTSAEIEFKVKRLGMWVGKATAYFKISDILNSNDATRDIVAPYVANNFAGLNSVMGIDLASVGDTTSIALCFEIPQPDGESILVFKTMGFIPENNIAIKEKQDGAPYRDWAKKEFIYPTPGNVIDYDKIKELIFTWKNNFHVIMVGYDAWQFEVIRQYLIKNNIFYDTDLKPVKQGISLTPILKIFERKLKLKKLHFLDNAYLIDHLTNVSVKQTNSINENVLIQKVSPTKRIDAFVSCLTALSVRWQVDPNYEDTGIVII